MDESYLRYSIADRHFYEHPVVAADSCYPLAAGCSWQDWTIRVDTEWVYVLAPDSPKRDQGWKIHISVVPHEAASLLEIVSRYCCEERIDFKYLPHELMVRLRDEKTADRAGSGKFITIYPREDADLDRHSHRLGRLLRDFHGPYILSDVRLSGVVYARYGAFRPRRGIDGDTDSSYLAILDPHGAPCPDPRMPMFAPPAWVDLPRCVRDGVARLGGSEPPADLPYVITGPMRMSATGAVYSAQLKENGQDIIVKHARAFMGHGPDGRDAIARLKHEAEVMEELSVLEGVPRLLDQRYIAEDFFVAETRLPGENLTGLTARHCPLLKADPSDSERAAYATRMTTIMASLGKLIGNLHSRGYVFGDLNAANVVVEDEQVGLVDLETVEKDSVGRGHLLVAPGFTPPSSAGGTVADGYSLGCIMLSVFEPMTALLARGDGRLERLCAQIAKEFPSLDPSYLARARELIEAASGGVPSQVVCQRVPERKLSSTLSSRAARAICASADVSRLDRLYPSDPAGLTGEGVGYLHGAAGVIDILGADLGDDLQVHLDWLDDVVINQHTDPGLLTGALGATLVLARYGRRDALRTMMEELIARSDFTLLPMNLARGLAGVLAALPVVGDFLPETKDALGVLRDKMRDEIRRRVRRRLKVQPPPSPSHPQGTGGLYYGLTGVSVGLLVDPQDEDIDLVGRILRRERAYLQPVDGAGVQLRETNRLMPYLGTGSAGVAVVAHTYRELCGDDEFDDICLAVDECARTRFVVQAGYSHGRAGLAAYLAARGQGDIARASMAGVEPYLENYRGGLLSVGDQLARLSADFGTGIAGIVWAWQLCSAAGMTSKDDPLLAKLFPLLRRDNRGDSQ